MWQKFGTLILTTIIWGTIFLSDYMFGEIYAQPLENMIVGVSCLFFLTFKGEFFDVKYFKEIVFVSLGIINIIIGLNGLIQI